MLQEVDVEVCSCIAYLWTIYSERSSPVVYIVQLQGHARPVLEPQKSEGPGQYLPLARSSARTSTTNQCREENHIPDAAPPELAISSNLLREEEPALLE